ncbi:MAG TPA: prephenate dehydratase [Dehalococcoidales bacterium]|nr:prephenate dehydratase [Dehalococcoidales bacterium]
MNLDDLRQRIDELDVRLVKTIAQRMQLSRQIGKEKLELGKPIEDRARENAVLEAVIRLAREEQINPEEIEKIYQRIFIASKEIQGITVAFQGELGAYSEEAAYQYFGAFSQLKPCESLEDAFQAVEIRDAQYGLVPVENSLEGSVPRTYDLLLDSSLRVAGETQLRVVHCLIGRPEATIDSIREVFSHTQALGQCKAFLRKMGWKANPAYDTAGAVKMVKDSGRLDYAAIASARAADIYGMKILARGIEDNTNNFTRFFVLARQDAPPSGNDKTSLVFSVKHTPGALYSALKGLADRKINLTRIESRPTRQKAWEYNFYVDIEGHRLDENIKTGFKELEEHAIFVKILGSYPKYRA